MRYIRIRFSWYATGLLTHNRHEATWRYIYADADGHGIMGVQLNGDRRTPPLNWISFLFSFGHRNQLNVCHKTISNVIGRLCWIGLIGSLFFFPFLLLFLNFVPLCFAPCPVIIVHLSWTKKKPNLTIWMPFEFDSSTLLSIPFAIRYNETPLWQRSVGFPPGS